ncbi:hypothetical protein [Salinarimonas ramus]|uniref:Uncharacterized protein n=1 Tax=Salinarimonas ramus TaxID=690164 RepID=A0A917Q7B6_9HYPH|nr:hypothetical protein [Salinarimonas ramus]GGK32775.1 hypothetical protein GCM10011322_19350 [Salinarimonas ramus]
MDDGVRIAHRKIEVESRDAPRRQPRSEQPLTRAGRPLMREILGPDGVVRTRIDRNVVLAAIRASATR